MHLLLVTFVFIAVFKASCGGFVDGDKDKMKKRMDENQMTEEQFYRCFSDMNCKMGDQVQKKVFDCYRKVSEEEVTEYCSWFHNCPVGNYTQTNIEDNIRAFCELNYEDQEIADKFFQETAAHKFKEVCTADKNSGKCKRLQKAQNCLTLLMGQKVYSGECDTAVKTAEESMKS